MVVGFHYRTSLNGVYAQTNLGDLLFLNGAFGVDLFFIISGFIIVYSTKNKAENTPPLFLYQKDFQNLPCLYNSIIFIANGCVLGFLNRIIPSNMV